MRSSDRIALASFAGYSILAGGNAVGIRFSNQELDPIWGATFRFGLAGLLMVIVMFLMGHRIPRGRALVGAALYGLLAFGGAFAFAFYALVELEAGFGQIILSVVPLLTLLLAVAQGLEKLRLAAAVGALVALAGVVIMSRLTLEGAIPFLSIVAAVLSAICFAQASITIKKFPQLHPIVTNAVGMIVGALFLALLTLVTGSKAALPQRAETWWAIGYMVLIGSGVVFSLYVLLLELWDASRASYGFVVVPIFTVLASYWLLDEAITVGLLLGGSLVLVGVYFGALQQTREEVPPRERSATAR